MELGDNTKDHICMSRIKPKGETEKQGVNMCLLCTIKTVLKVKVDQSGPTANLYRNRTIRFHFHTSR